MGKCFIMRLLMMMGNAGFLRIGFVAPLGGAGVVGVVLALMARWDVLFSLAAGVLAVALPLLAVVLRKEAVARGDRAVGNWAVKFSLTILLLAVGARGLSETLLMNAPGFMIGVVTGIVVNLFITARMTLVTGGGNQS